MGGQGRGQGGRQGGASSGGPGWRARGARLRDRVAARLSARARVAPGALAVPEPRLAGDPAAGGRLLEGRLRLGGEVVDLGDRSPWDLPPDLPGDAGATDELHAFRWLDDLAAVGGPRARRQAQAWVGEWIGRFGAGAGPGWAPGLAGARLLRWTGHAGLLLRGQGEAERDRLARSLAGQALFLARRVRALPPGVPRVEPLAALVQAGLVLPGSRELARQAALGLGREAQGAVDAAGAVASRAPEELLDVLELLAGAARAITEADLLAPQPRPGPGSGGGPGGGPLRAIAEAAGRAAPTLRALRHADGGLARFHGGCRGAQGRLDAALAGTGRPGLAGAGGRGGRPVLAMGYTRLAAGRVSVIADASLPPRGPASTGAHASALAFELTSGRRPVVVSCGPGRAFGAEWRRAGRATPSHSALTLDGLSSSRVAPPRPGEAAGRLVEGPTRVIFEPTPLSGGLRVEMAHDGWRASHGLTHARTLHLALDGRRLAGEDLLTTLTAADGRALDRAMGRGEGLGLAIHVRFHLHPDVEAEPLSDGTVALDLRSGERWVLAQEGASQVSLDASAYLEEGSLEPRPSTQVVLLARAVGPTTRLRWTLAKAKGTPQGLRDLVPDRDANGAPGWGREENG